jgi:hypothetical protein
LPPGCNQVVSHKETGRDQLTPYILRKESAIMSVKPQSSPSFFDRLFNVLLADWWIDVILMLFIVGSMVCCHG